MVEKTRAPTEALKMLPMINCARPWRHNGPNSMKSPDHIQTGTIILQVIFVGAPPPRFLVDREARSHLHETRAVDHQVHEAAGDETEGAVEEEDL